MNELRDAALWVIERCGPKAEITIAPRYRMRRLDHEVSITGNGQTFHARFNDDQPDALAKAESFARLLAKVRDGEAA